MTSHPIIARSRRLDLDPAALRARVRAMAQPALISGLNVDGPPGRWSVLAARPRLIFESKDGEGWRWLCGWNQKDLIREDALVGLAGLIDVYLGGRSPRGAGPELDENLPFQGGWIGHLAYDLAPKVEAVRFGHKYGSPVPALRFGFYDTFVLVDHDADVAGLWAVNLIDSEGPADLERRLDDWETLLRRPAPTPARPVPALAIEPEYAPGLFRQMVERAKRYIEAGDIFQVNLSHPFHATGWVDPAWVDDRLEAASPAPYSAYLGWGEHAIVSRSPELFYATAGRRIVTRPIKGTRPRSAEPDRDAALAAELLASPKDLAELTMIVDLERNDLGRVCEFGSVRVVEPRVLESFGNVHHTVATVEGRLRADVGPVDVVRALFPGGSITGAPKIRAMQIIDQLEPARRGVYTGAIGFWSANGRSSFNIAIRTVVVGPLGLHYHVGGGIVAESDPEREYQETLDKGRTIFETLQGSGADR